MIERTSVFRKKRLRHLFEACTYSGKMRAFPVDVATFITDIEFLMSFEDSFGDCLTDLHGLQFISGDFGKLITVAFHATAEYKVFHVYDIKHVKYLPYLLS